MYSNDEKLRMIKQEIDQTTEEMVGAILDKVQKKRISRLSDAEAKANEEAALMVEKAKRDAKTRETTAVSRATLQYRTQLLQKSEVYAQEIFAAAQKELSAFAASEAYTAYIQKRLAQVAKNYQFDTVYLRIAPQDEPLKELYSKAFSTPCVIEIDPENHLGGFIAENRTEGFACDETLQNALSEQKSWFYSNSGLTIQAI